MLERLNAYCGVFTENFVSVKTGKRKKNCTQRFTCALQESIWLHIFRSEILFTQKSYRIKQHASFITRKISPERLLL